MQTISDDLQQYHWYVPMFKHAYERLRLEESRGVTDIQVCLQVDPTTDGRRYNLSASNTEIAIAMPGSGESKNRRDIILRLRSAGHQRISEMHPAYLTLHYVLLFPCGEFGWHKRIPHKDVDLPQVNNREGVEMEDPDDNGNSQHKHLTQREFYAHMLHQHVIDDNKVHNIFLAQDLFQQFIVDAWAQIEQTLLNFIKFNQNKLQSEITSTIVDTLPNEYDNNRLAEIGRKVILPSSFAGGEHQMFQLYQDSMAIARFCGRVNFFLTQTANPNWKEITDELLPGQQPSDRPDLVARVFHMKMQALIKDIREGLLGFAVAHIHTVEYQKRGLPHMHLLIFVNYNSCLNTPDDVDEMIRAEFPDETLEPELHALVIKYMVHGPCDSQCLDATTKQCTKRLSKAIQRGYRIKRKFICIILSS